MKLDCLSVRRAARGLAGRRFPPALALSLACLAGSAGIAAAMDPTPELNTNQAYVEAVNERPDLDIGNIDDVFGYVFAKLPDVVKVYPTENYYYFKFPYDGVIYSGNFRLDVDIRDKGTVYFAYFETFTDWRRDEIDKFKGFSGKDGVTVKKVAPLVYTIAYNGKTVRFELNDLGDVVPPQGTLDKDERYIGPVFDESGMQFYLVYNAGIKNFLYILNEQQPVPDELYTSDESDRILIGRRTGFAYYLDDKLERKILIGVNQHNVQTNNYLDGPFDQLPDNFITGDTLRTAILETDPSYEGKIDRFGILPGGDDRFLIAPYMSYTYTDELLAVSDCASDPTVPGSDYYNCFIIIDDEEATDGSDAADTSAETGSKSEDGADGVTGEPKAVDEPPMPQEKQ